MALKEDRDKGNLGAVSAQQGMARVVAHRKGGRSQERLTLVVWEV